MSVTDGEDIVELILPKLLQTGDLVTSILFERSIVQEWNSLRKDPRAMPPSVAFSFLTLVYGSVALTALYCILLEESLPGNMGPAEIILNICLTNCLQCWQHSDPDRPGQYKVEAAIVRLAVTVYHQSDLQRAYTALGHAIALAESSGYRESDVLHPSDFKGELRRRAWLLLENFDYRICSSFGRLQRISHKQRKLELRNLSETSFDAYSTELPLQRRLDQLTRVLPLILISAIRNVSAKITLDIFGRDDITSKDIQDFDQELDAVYQRVPKTITGDPVKVLQLQYTIAIIYHAAKIVLHRWSVLDENMDRSDPYANHSRGQCIGSAVEIMKIQKSLLDNRRSHHNRWELDPLTMYDFLFAGIILCLELSYLIRPQRLFHRDVLRPEIFTRTVLHQLLSYSLEFWGESRSYGIPLDRVRICAIFTRCVKEVESHAEQTGHHADPYFNRTG
ncbi:hypothetical protein BKA67DRAFT_570760 [Truncatella angustata]|uniref:Transcription factor domain-containing protein n=1 Tax=Truncatella angustata TaxID=152316 RepID=A0A9P8UK46_9PEZI|nr:uncharacterized protein BKA67DRAFT_570760 [Truncatella angustata]KAH6653651.1 hypothetical protein BKA67DRAFT_570760 [Truncatella angustata]